MKLYFQGFLAPCLLYLAGVLVGLSVEFPSEAGSDGEVTPGLALLGIVIGFWAWKRIDRDRQKPPTFSLEAWRYGPTSAPPKGSTKPPPPPAPPKKR